MKCPGGPHDAVLTEVRLVTPTNQWAPVRVEEIYRCQAYGCREGLIDHVRSAHDPEASLGAAMALHGMLRDPPASAASFYQRDSSAGTTSSYSVVVVVPLHQGTCASHCIQGTDPGTGASILHAPFCPEAPDGRSYDG